VPCSDLPPPTIGLVPDVVGRLAVSASELLKEAGFQVGTRRVYCPAYPSGYVCSQTPEGGDITLPGSTVTIAVSDDSAVASVPMVLGKTVSAARSQLEAAGFTVAVTIASNDASTPGCRQPSETRSGYVWLQQPCAGETAGAGSTVRISVNP
jgi:eukaryotic-like serine/threonine-protein kinase